MPHQKEGDGGSMRPQDYLKKGCDLVDLIKEKKVSDDKEIDTEL